jgi:hypothetical protein
MTVSIFEMKAQVDPQFHIYLCFGQSNMEGGVPAESIDMEYVDPRFRVLATDATNENRDMGKWYTAYPRIVGLGGLCPIDYFGRSMVAALPADYKVGVVAVASGGVDIRAFFPETGADYIKYKENPKVAKYDSELYKRLVDMAKIAQQSGVIKGILMHQGEANCGQTQWPQYVKTIYDRLISDLHLNAAEVPLLVGEVSEGSEYAAHNKVIAQVPSVIPTAHVVSSTGCPGDIHFSAVGYRMLGMRYAIKMLELLGYPARKDANYQLHESVRKFYSASLLDQIESITLQPSETYEIPAVTAHFEDGHSESVSTEVVVTCTGKGMKINGNKLTAVTGKRSLVTVNYTDFTGNTVSTSFYVNASNPINGDVNGDDVLDDKDLKALINHIMGMPQEGFFDVNMANINKDDKVDATDVVCLINLMRLNQ